MTTEANGPTVRRWLDKALLGAAGLIVVLLGTLWSLTWLQARGDIGTLDTAQRDGTQRLLVVESELGHIRNALGEIKADIRYIKEKLK